MNLVLLSSYATEYGQERCCSKLAKSNGKYTETNMYVHYVYMYYIFSQGILIWYIYTNLHLS